METAASSPPSSSAPKEEVRDPSRWNSTKPPSSVVSDKPFFVQVHPRKFADWYLGSNLDSSCTLDFWLLASISHTSKTWSSVRRPNLEESDIRQLSSSEFQFKLRFLRPRAAPPLGLLAWSVPRAAYERCAFGDPDPAILRGVLFPAETSSFLRDSWSPNTQHRYENLAKPTHSSNRVEAREQASAPVRLFAPIPLPLSKPLSQSTVSPLLCLHILVLPVACFAGELLVVRLAFALWRVWS